MKMSTGRPRRIASVLFATAVSAALLAALGGVNVAQGVIGLAQYAYGKEKAYVCHKGKKTLRIGKPAVAAHLRHGDQVGTCAQVAAKQKAAKLKAAKLKAAKLKAAKQKAAKQRAAKRKQTPTVSTAGNGKSAGKGSGGRGNGKR